MTPRHGHYPIVTTAGQTRSVAWWPLLVALLLVLGGMYVLAKYGTPPPPPDTRHPVRIRVESSVPPPQEPALTDYVEVTTIPTGMQQARAVAVAADGRIYLAGDRIIRILNAQGTLQRTLALAAEPYCLAIAPDDTLYVGLREHIEVYQPNGKLAARWASLGSNAYLTSLAIAGGNLWAADAGRRVVVHYTRNGRIAGRIGARDASRDLPGLVVPSPHLDVAISPSGQLWVADPGRHRLEAYTPDGAMKTCWGTASASPQGFSGCCNPTDFAMLPDGRFVTSEKGLPRVKVYSAAGTFERVVAGPAYFPDTRVGRDVAVDATQRILILDPPTRAVRVFARKDAHAR